MQAVGKTVVEFDSLSRRLLLKLYIYRVSIGSSAIAPIVYRQAAALWPLLSLGGSSAIASIVYRQAAVVQGLIVSQR